MILLTVDEIIELHEKLIVATGGSSGIRDRTLLESAVLGCTQTFGGEELYPTIVEKVARLAYAICNNHAFIDGNKRVAVTALLVVLRMNDITLKFTQQELITLGLGIADSSIDYEGVVNWVRTYIVD